MIVRTRRRVVILVFFSGYIFTGDNVMSSSKPQSRKINLHCQYTVDGDDNEDVDEKEQEEGGDCGVFSRDICLQVIM